MRRLFFFLPLATVLFILPSCLSRPVESQNSLAVAAPTAVPSPTPLPRTIEATDANLTQEYARFRSRLISKITYALTMQLQEEAEDFGGDVTIGFTLSGVSDQLGVDFKAGGTVSAIRLNGSTVDIGNYRVGHIFFPPQNLRLGRNEVTISFRQKFSKDSTGFYRFKDPEDKRVYVWTQFESYYANYMFPCFDQPDLKAPLSLQVQAPVSWEVVSTTRETSVVASSTGRTWVFPPTPPLSTYLYSLHAGPFKSWSSTAGSIPLRLFARRSLAAFVKPEEWFAVTQAGLKFYGHYFDYPYPFKKYDQLIVPDFEGAMENVAAVTFSEEFVVRGAMTRNEREGLTSTILHEMAHMWFGNLVTMEWWNGLWLNESFASYMAAVAEFEVTEFKDSWIGFHEGLKTWAYREDQLVTTHPIESAIPDTRAALTAFDGVTYGKGASVLKQLNFFIDPDRFRDGVRQYFKDYEYENTQLEDFVGALGLAAKRDLIPWSKKWLMTSGLDTVRVNFTCANGKVSTLQVVSTVAEGQDPSSLNAIRPHRIRIGLYSGKAALTLTHAANVELLGAMTDVPDLYGKPCPEFVAPNEGDHDYVKAKFDAKSLATVRTRLADLKDPFTRMLVWTSLADMLRDGDLSPQAYLAIVEKSLERETNLKVTLAVFRTLISSGSQIPVFYYLPVRTETDRAARLSAVRRIEDLLWRKLLQANPETDWPRTYLDGLTRLAESPQAMERLASLLDGTSTLKIHHLDQDRRWETVVRLMALGFPKAEALLAREKSRDTSERGLQMALAAEASRPTLENKRKWLIKIADLSSTELTLSRRDVILRYFLPKWQDGLRAELSETTYQTLLTLTLTADQEIVERFARYMVPATCDGQSDKKLNEFLTARANSLQPAVLKVLRVANQENQRCLRIRESRATR